MWCIYYLHLIYYYIRHHFIFMRTLFFSLVIVCFHHCSYAQDSVAHPVKAKTYTAANPTFPFILSLTSIEYDVTINLNDPKVVEKYSGLFKQLNIPFTADAWEDVISGLMQNSDSLMEHEITTSAENGVLRIGTGGTEYQKAFISYMLPLFSDTRHLEAVLKKEE
jgi:hypothetical protein